VHRITLPILLVLLGLSGQPAWCAGPALTTQQIQTAIQEGSKYKAKDNFLKKGLKGKKVKIDGAMARDGLSKYATFFNDQQAVAAEAAAAHQQMRELKVADVQSNGLLHVFVEVRGGGVVGVSRLDRRYQGERAHLVLKMGDRIFQPVKKAMIRQSNETGSTLLLFGASGLSMRKITLEFAFDVSPSDLQSLVEVILIDGDGNKHQQKVDLKGILDIS
jgi:hypothetical protein